MNGTPGNRSRLPRVPVPHLLSRWSWLDKALLAICDQALYALANFALMLLLARRLSAEEFGIFSVAFSILMLFGVVHSSVLSEPLLIFAALPKARGFRSYLSLLLSAHLLLSVIAFALLLAASAGLASAKSPLAGPVFFLALSLPFILLGWLMRRVCYAVFRPGLSAVAGICYGLAIAIGTWVCAQWSGLSAGTALLLMAMGSIISSAVIAAMILRANWPRDRVCAREMRIRHWQYARWSLASNSLLWLVSNVPGLMLPLWLDLAALGQLRALVTLIMPAWQVTGALSTLLLPRLAAERDARGFTRLLRLALGAIIMLNAAYALVLLPTHDLLLRHLYGGKYGAGAGIMGLLLVWPVLSAVGEVLTAALRALERVDWVFITTAIYAALVLLLSALFVPPFGVAGALFASVAASAAGTVLLASGGPLRPALWQNPAQRTDRMPRTAPPAPGGRAAPAGATRESG